MIRCHPDRLASENRSNFGDASHLPPYILSLVLAARNNLAKLYPGLCVGVVAYAERQAFRGRKSRLQTGAHDDP